MTEQNKEVISSSPPSIVLQPDSNQQGQTERKNEQQVDANQDKPENDRRESQSHSQVNIEPQNNDKEGDNNRSSNNNNSNNNNNNNTQQSIEKVSTFRSSVKRMGSQGSLKSQNTENGNQQNTTQRLQHKTLTNHSELPKLDQHNYSRIGLAGSTLLRGGDTASLGKILGSVKRERKQTEMEALALSGRISLLKQEEENSRKKFFSTKRQTLDYFILKKSNETQQDQKRKDEEEKAAQLKSQWEENEKHRMRKRSDRDFARNNVLQSNRNHYFQVKKQQMENESMIELRNGKGLEQMKQKKQMIHQHELQGTMRIFDFKNRQAEMCFQSYRKSIENNELIKQGKVQEIEKMEQLELSLIKKLQVTQQLQRQAFEELQGIITMRSDDFHKQFNPVFSKRKVNKLIKSTTDEVYNRKDRVNESQLSQNSGSSSIKGGNNRIIYQEDKLIGEVGSAQEDETRKTEVNHMQRSSALLDQKNSISQPDDDIFLPQKKNEIEITDRNGDGSAQLKKTKSTFKKKKSKKSFNVPPKHFPEFVF